MKAGVYRHYLLTVLLVVLVFNYLDRLALGMVLQNIKVDLHLTDTQLGLLSGIAFAFFYSVMGLPIARWADRGDRVKIIALTAALWSVAVALCGAARSFPQLLLIRVGVAVGEAGCIPPALSLIADYFNRAGRPRATAIYGFGGPCATVIGFFLAGWLNQLYGWRITFALLGAPGLLLSAVAWLTLREPRRSRAVAASAEPPQPSLKIVVTTLWGNASFRHLLLCLSVMFFFLYGVLTWQPTFFIRSFKLTGAQLGAGMALAYGVGGLLGSYIGGELASRYAAGNERLQLKFLASAITCAGAIATFTYFSHTPWGAFALAGIAFMALTTANGPLIATIQTLVPERMRAVSIAIVYMFANLIGMGLGPLAVGALSDALNSWAGDDSLRDALLLLTPGYLWSAWHALRASRTITQDLMIQVRSDQ